MNEDTERVDVATDKILLYGRYVRVAFIVYWFVDGADHFTGQYELRGLTDAEVAKLLCFASTDDMRPDVQGIPREGVLSFGKTYNVPVDPDRYVYVVEETGFYD